MNQATVNAMTDEMRIIIAGMDKLNVAALLGIVTAKFPTATMIEFAAAMHAATR